MKKFILVSLLTLIASVTMNAQNVVVWQDDFSGDKGWQTFTRNGGLAEYTKDGKLLMRCEEKDQQYISLCKTTLNADKNFIISVEAEARSGLKYDSFFGIVFNYLDRMNYMRFYVEKDFVYFEEVRDGKVVRNDYDLIKKTKAKTFELQVKKIGNTVSFIVNEEEALDITHVDVVSSKIALYVSGKTQVTFDNMKIMQ